MMMILVVVFIEIKLRTMFTLNIFGKMVAECNVNIAVCTI